MAKKSSKRSAGAVSKAWAIFNKNPKAERHEVLATCEKAGINPNTAKTQYQRWLHASKAQRAVMGGTKRPNVEKKSDVIVPAAASVQS